VGAKHPEHSIVAIENGHVTGRKVGDGASHVVLEQVRQADAQPSDHLSYLTKTPDGKILKSSTMYIRGRSGNPWHQLRHFLAPDGRGCGARVDRHKG
jgi:predicted transcriptional regulator YheO